MKKKILIAVLILIMATGCGKVPKLSDGKEAVVTFDNEKLSISVDDLYDAIKEKYALNVLVDLMDREILLNKFPDIKEEAEEFVKLQIEEVKSNYKNEQGAYDESALIRALTDYYGITTVEEFEEMLELSFYRSKAIEDYAKAKVEKKEIEKYYKDNIEGEIEASHILIKPEVTQDMSADDIKKAENAALKIAKDVIKKLDKGEDFAELAKEYSDDKANSDDGGSLGYFDNTINFDPAFKKAAFALGVNKYTKTPVKSQFGYHIIIKTAEKEKPSLEDSKEKITEILAQEIQSKDNSLAINALADLRKDYGFKIQDSSLKKKYSSYLSNQLLTLQQQNEAQ